MAIGLELARVELVNVLSPLIGDTKEHFRAILPYAPMQYNPLPLLYIGQANYTVNAGSREQWIWRVPLTGLIAQKGNFAQEMAVMEPFMEQIAALIAGNVSLNGTVDHFNHTDGIQGGVTINNTEYIGFTMFFHCKQTTPRNYRHHS